jgi:predicted DNA-binding transcriptional regulator YafY
VDRFDRIYVLDRLLRQARRPISLKGLMDKLECSRATVFRAMEDLRDHLGAPLVYDRARDGYWYDAKARQYELPGLWFSASELYALLVIQHLLGNLRPGLLEQQLAPLRARIEDILRSEGFGGSELPKRVRLLQMAARPESEWFGTVASALVRRRRLFIQYHGRARDETSERDVSPQRLVYYRDNWYLDGWCHQRNALRSFAVDRIRRCAGLDQAAKEVDREDLDDYYATAYGIFSGKPVHVAVLRFSAHAARWVADEHWHPQQSGQRLTDGAYELRVPYGDPRELIRDILRYGADVEVAAPKELRKEVAARLREAASLYRAG